MVKFKTKNLKKSLNVFDKKLQSSYIMKKKTRSKEKQVTFKHGSNLFPKNIRALIVGPSGCGKTQLLFSIIVHKNGLRFKDIHLFTQTANQEKYQMLKEIFKHLNSEQYLHIYEEFPKNNHKMNIKPDSLICIDDILCTKENKQLLSEIFARGRHFNNDVVLLYQSYGHLPRNFIRNNANFICIFPGQDEVSLQHIYEDHVGIDFQNFKQFKDLCYFCWGSLEEKSTEKMKKSYSFLTINKEAPLEEKYRKCLDKIIIKRLEQEN